MAQEIGQRRAGRGRVPRVQIAYDLRIGAEDRRKELPFVVGVLGDFAGNPDPALPRLRERAFVEVTRAGFSGALKALHPRLAFSVPNRLAAEDSQLRVTILFEELADFGPEAVAWQVEPVRALLMLRRHLSALRALGHRDRSVAARVRAGGENVVTLAAQLAEDGTAALAGGAWSDVLGSLASAVRGGADLEALLSAHIGDIDARVSAQVNEIVHAVPFQRLEAAWRGVAYLVAQTEASAAVKVRLLQVSKSDLLRDLEAASEFDQSTLFKKIYEEEYGIFGGEPFGVLVGDYEFGRHPQDVALLERLAGVAAAAHAPFLAAAGPALFGWESFAQLSLPTDLPRLFSTTEYVKWRAFRDMEDARYVGLTLPRMLLREPYRSETVDVESFVFREDVEGPDSARYLWGNAAFALGARVADAFARTGWSAAIRGVEGGGLVRGLPSPSVETDAGQVVVKGPLEYAVTEEREKALADCGFVPLAHCKGTEYAVFFSVQSCQRPRPYDTDEANANARLATQLQYILATSRFAHYLKVMMRDKTGAVTEQRQAEDYLNRWLMDYCLGNPESADLEARARKPLRDGHVTVREARGKPGSYEAVIHLQPHFQLDELTVALRLVTELPPPVDRR